MSPLQLVLLGTFGLALFLGGLVVGFVAECANLRRAERDLCVPLPDEAVTR